MVRKRRFPFKIAEYVILRNEVAYGKDVKIIFGNTLEHIWKS